RPRGRCRGRSTTCRGLPRSACGSRPLGPGGAHRWTPRAPRCWDAWGAPGWARAATRGAAVLLAAAPWPEAARPACGRSSHPAGGASARRRGTPLSRGAALAGGRGGVEPLTFRSGARGAGVVSRVPFAAFFGVVPTSSFLPLAVGLDGAGAAFFGAACLLVGA